MTELLVEDLHKRIGGNDILQGVSVKVEAGEVVALLGESGSGKTTVLRSVAGLEVPDRGRIALADRMVFDAASGVAVPAEKRGLGLVFQSYALWPNRTVHENVAYGLKLRRASTEETATRVQEVLERLGLGAFGKRYPHQLSGGQQQRVAVARALVYRPRLLLLDEPLSNLDAKLREDARSWLRQAIRESGLSALYVTHDQVEAMAVADRLVVLHAGRVEQEGSPQDIYERPATLRTASFIGSNNLLPGVIGSVEGGSGRIDLPEGSLRGVLHGTFRPGDRAVALVRIERTRLGTATTGNGLPVQLRTSLYLGERWEHVLANGSLPLRAWSPAPLPAGAYHAEAHPEDVWIFPAPESPAGS